MPRKGWIDKHSATTFQLLYRSQNDPLINDSSAQDRTLFPVAGSAPETLSTTGLSSRGVHLSDLENDVDLDSMRENEGEAAAYGVYYDDTDYDYMQHLRDVGDESGQSHFVDSAMIKVQGKGKGKAKMMKLEDALRGVSLESENENGSVTGRSVSTRSVRFDDMSTASTSSRPKTYQDMQDVPDEIGGFQPDMDPRLREVLEALEDDAYVDDEDEEDALGTLVQGAHRSGELDLAEFGALQEEEDDGWESDATEKATDQSPTGRNNIPASLAAAPVDLTDISTTEAEAASAEDGDWLRDFAKFKAEKTSKSRPQKALNGSDPRQAESHVEGTDIEAPASTLYTLGGTPLRRKKRKGAQTNPSAYSMTSSSLARTDGQRLLDDRFDQIETLYSLDEDLDDDEDDQDGVISLAPSGMSKNSRASMASVSSVRSFVDGGPVRSDFDGMMDGFLRDWDQGNPGGGKRRGAKGKRGKNGNEVAGMRMLDEVREGLGPARLKQKV